MKQIKVNLVFNDRWRDKTTSVGNAVTLHRIYSRNTT